MKAGTIRDKLHKYVEYCRNYSYPGDTLSNFSDGAAAFVDVLLNEAPLDNLREIAAITDSVNEVEVDAADYMSSKHDELKQLLEKHNDLNCTRYVSYGAELMCAMLSADLTAQDIEQDFLLNVSILRLEELIQTLGVKYE